MPIRFQWLAAAAAVALCSSSFLPAQDTRYPPQGEQFPGPPAKTDTADWLKELKQYREERRIRAGLSGGDTLPHLGELLVLPFTFTFLLLYAAQVHFRRWLRTQ